MLSTSATTVDDVGAVFDLEGDPLQRVRRLDLDHSLAQPQASKPSSPRAVWSGGPGGLGVVVVEQAIDLGRGGANGG
ncbi:hypothetical protein GCM10010232_71020 [Streptomyces amakusaensis]